MDKRLDEHDPNWTPEDDPLPKGFLGALTTLGTAAALGLAAACVATFLGGCDGDYERQVRAAELRAKFFNACLPRKGDTVTAYWSKGELLCQRMTPTGRYGKTFPHTEARVARLEDME